MGSWPRKAPHILRDVSHTTTSNASFAQSVPPSGRSTFLRACGPRTHLQGWENRLYVFSSVLLFNSFTPILNLCRCLFSLHLSRAGLINQPLKLHLSADLDGLNILTHIVHTRTLRPPKHGEGNKGADYIYGQPVCVDLLLPHALELFQIQLTSLQQTPYTPASLSTCTYLFLLSGRVDVTIVPLVSISLGSNLAHEQRM